MKSVFFAPGGRLRFTKIFKMGQFSVIYFYIPPESEFVSGKAS